MMFQKSSFLKLMLSQPFPSLTFLPKFSKSFMILILFWFSNPSRFLGQNQRLSCMFGFFFFNGQQIGKGSHIALYPNPRDVSLILVNWAYKKAKAFRRDERQYAIKDLQMKTFVELD